MTLSEDITKATAGSPARRRLEALFDGGSLNEIDALVKSKNGFAEVLAGYGTVDGDPVYAFSQDASRIGGAVSIAQSSKVRKIYDLAAKTGAPVVGIYDSDGMLLNEGVDALAAFGEMVKASSNVSGIVPQISVIAGSCVGLAALMAVNTDFVVMTENSEVYLSGKPQSAAAAAENGIAAMVVENDIKAIEAAKALLLRLPSNNLSPALPFDPGAPRVSTSAINAGTQLSLSALEDAVFDAGTVLPVYEGFGRGTKTAFACIDGTHAGVIVYEKNVSADGALKAARFVRFCDSFSIPVISFVDTLSFDEGATTLKYSGILSGSYVEATTQKIAVISGKAYGAAYVVLAGRAANADLVYAWDNASISSLSPDAAVSVLWNERLAAGEKRAALVDEYISTVATPENAAEKGYVDDIFDAAQTRDKLCKALDMLSGKRIATLPRKHSNLPL